MVFKSGDSLRDLWDNIRHTSIHIIGVPVGQERETEANSIFEDIIAKNFTNLRKETFRTRKHRKSQTGSTKKMTSPRHTD